MKKLLVLVLFAAGVQAGVLDDLESVRAAVFRKGHLANIGTAQLTTAEVDSQINEANQLFGAHREFQVVPYAKWDSITVVEDQWLYALNSDFVQLLRVLKSWVNEDGVTVTQVVPIGGQMDVVKTTAGEAPKYAWASEGMLEIYPVPTGEQAYLTLYISYQAHPPPLTMDTSSILIKQSLRSMLVDYVLWKVLEKIGSFGRAQLARNRLPASLTGAGVLIPQGVIE